jgi:vacuolar protein sorting-associated protein 13A/C
VMFERYLTDALTTHFGHVVENLDSDKVRLSAWNGELVLNDLSLRPTALESFISDCPVEIAYGSVGNLELRIPWNLFRSQLRWRKAAGPRISETGCSIVLSDVNILVTPRRQNSDASNDNEEAVLSLEELRLQKEKQVQSLLNADLLQRITESTVSSGRWTWLQDLLSNLVSTLSVTVRDVHIRYEDPGTSMGFVWSSDSPDE